ncbi:MAG: hypothetical protein A3I88_00400 [Candidatus Portnoybacteria bacterium RIFCSPLOWO2_12_FULL_39_9]|uniref:Endolytic murein transglycosylase n=1 Tax=Candidatus Portnoybacteria bacterium RIFCSPHIGHO2_12_FULL_38_9 TaxID=1801997 RepID=A0A1G2FDX0_9BACT|nr:MAG: hypothetical protein A3H00_02540 [Candidatus Portnoybacteria bacterium RBG_13_40_8]OGZ36256.1 MAG: hypothetical protein A3J64_00425 [Candidatus Portnoybacteria bacterium RIFCSPHIGHO2_12_FULL_38_9]OGZ36945.1 MAG: hypothetical protein A2646_03575 [Candidatus Portnoybacteria bacterium RIFCSPHIGHO2_02_FULL_39_12]OGZ37993.1 MAG: hypothetical protein A3F21_01520 [Candidatus Portnoybacteria bacterium RIFCSPLOWO2_01_FULL_38_39]OGZ40074.1 MAG: hypothetical protein A3I88_00400 [Candidatus Portnoy
MIKKYYYLFSIILLCLVVSLTAIFIYRQITAPLSYQFKEKTFVIKKGESLGKISSRLEKEGLVSQDYWFKFYVLTKGWAARLQAGEYLLSPSMAIVEIAEKVVKGQTSSEIQVTIPEGFTIKQIDNRLVKAGLIKKEELVNFNPKEFLISNFQFPIFNLEGFLFPDTYNFSKNSAVEEIVKKMTDNFSKKLTDDLRLEIQKQNKTIFEIITLASIVQNEAMNDEEMPVLAGVFYQRLKIGLALQSDATVNYITGKNLRQPSREDTLVNSPYNTYRHKGLPPGPISNPGLTAIKAAIYPEKTDYLYFLHPLNGPTVFSRDLKEHNLNKAEYLP